MLAIRLASYYEAQPEALPHAAASGFKYVFMNVVPPDKIEATRKNLVKYGLKVAVFRGEADLSEPESVAQLAEQLATCEKMGVRYLFLSPKFADAPRGEIIARLKALGPLAKRHGVVVGLETHPPLGTNGQLHVETMKAVDHPNIRVNFDTANITYYNKGTDAVTELKKCIDYVGTVEIKDHDCRFESWDFPPLGRGKVDIPAVLKLLNRHGYTGPITIEVEGVKGVQRSKEQIKREIAESGKYLRSLQDFD
ncbi:MAG: sugar phosphate isomerase/epimerase [Pirellulales bacterium]|nr:sugar phosphate isomerase/epimerase [Pirellulales bacterium]